MARSTEPVAHGHSRQGVTLRQGAFVLAGIFAALVLTHLPLLRLPYYWDEAGYYIPAAYDFLRSGSLIPYSTLSNAHPPLPSLYLAALWKLFGFTPLVTRIAMCFVSAVALAAVYALSVETTGKPQVGAATVLVTALYPIWFAQSTLAHADMFAAAAVLWGIYFYLRDRAGWGAAVCFSLAVLAKETALVTPLALAIWGMRLAAGAPNPRRRLSTIVRLALPILPLALWYLYHWRRTGFVFGNPEYLRYNATQTLTPLRILLAFLHRLMHITLHMNLFVPVLAMFACMLLPPVSEDRNAPRERISFADQKVFYVVIAASVLCFSVLGGALLTRYLLPCYPLVLLMCVNTFRRRLRGWLGLVALTLAAFVAGLFVNPPYRFAPEDNLAYSDMIRLQQAAIQQIETRYPGATVLTAWPASDELTKPELGYVSQPLSVVPIDNFSFAQVERAAQSPTSYTVALIFSTKYDPPHLLLSLGHRNQLYDQRFFSFHRDLSAAAAARLLGGSVVWRQQRKGQWAALIHFDRPVEARLSFLP